MTVERAALRPEIHVFKKQYSLSAGPVMVNSVISTWQTTLGKGNLQAPPSQRLPLLPLYSTDGKGALLSVPMAQEAPRNPAWP